MKNPIINENLKKLYAAAQDDSELLELISDCLKSFEEYHASIYEMETWLALNDYGTVSREEYQEGLTELDKRRTICHNSVLDSVNILNRIAAQKQIPAVYEGEVSKEHPIRREVADAVLSYAESIVLGRR